MHVARHTAMAARAHVAPYPIPVLVDVDFGHTDPRLTLPIGAQASLDSAEDLFSLDEAAVI